MVFIMYKLSPRTPAAARSSAVTLGQAAVNSGRDQSENVERPTNEYSSNCQYMSCNTPYLDTVTVFLCYSTIVIICHLDVRKIVFCLLYNITGRVLSRGKKIFGSFDCAFYL